MKFHFILLFLSMMSCAACTDRKKDGDNRLSGDVQTHVQKMEPVHETTTVLTPGNVLNCIIITGDSIYCYFGNSVKEGAYYSLKNGANTYREFILQQKKIIGDSLTVLLKPANSCTYRNTVDILDEMTINGISSYAMLKVNEEEKSFLHIKEFDANPPEPVEVRTPSSVVSQKLPETDAFLIDIRKGGSVWYQVLSAEPADSAFHKINNPVTGNLKKVIAAYIARFPDAKKSFLIKGHNSTSYKTFEEVTLALKENNILKYNLITSMDDAANK